MSFKPTFSLSTFIFIKRLFSSSSLSAIRVVSSAYLRLLIFLLALLIPASAYLKLLIFLPAILIPAVLHPAQRFSWCTLHISQISRVTIYSLMYSFSYLEPVSCSMSSSNCCFLTCIQVSQEAGQVACYSHLFQNFPQFIVIHTVKGFGIVNNAQADVFLELSCFFDDPVDVGNLVSGSSAFLKPAWTSGISWFMYCWSLASRILSITLLACEMSAIVW